MGRYVVLEQLGAGAMGRVVRAYDPELARDVAIKLVRGASHAIASARLVREAQTLARLSHENVVAVYDVGTEGDDVFVAMELIEGRDLARWIAEAPRAWPEVLEVIGRVAAGLQAAHDAGIVHRDLKPSNILIAGDPTARRSHGRVAVGDFGLARGQQQPDSPAAPVDPWGPLADDTLTATGTTVGTPAYMAPEQHAWGHADARADQYALAVTLFECLWGRRPFAGADVDSLLAHKRAGVGAAPEGAVPRRLWPAIARALAVDPAQRFASVADFVAALRGLAARPARRRRAAIGLVAVAAVGLSIARPWASAAAPCEGLDAPLRAVWNADSSTALEQALQRRGGAGGRELAAVVHALLDEHAQAWLAVRDEVCRATWIEQRRSIAALDHAMACLDRELSRMHATVRVLTEADANAALRAPEIVASLHSPRACLQAADGPAAGDEGLRALLAAIETRLAAGDVATAEAELAAVQPRIAERGDAELALALAVL
ncbi:MAG: serine/threonine protein kinase, partial [Nannocystaceae bacterium]|nr:serine/threonine protein kinase [Nannocystaceae bacterium]